MPMTAFELWTSGSKVTALPTEPSTTALEIDRYKTRESVYVPKSR